MCPVGVALSEVEGVGEETLGRIVVRVHYYGREMEPAGLLGDRVGRSGQEQSGSAEKTSHHRNE